MQRFMVCPKDAVDGGIRSSQHFPVIVEFPRSSLVITAEEILQKCFTSKFSPRDHKQYYIVPMDNAILATCRYRRDFDVEVEYVR